MHRLDQACIYEKANSFRKTLFFPCIKKTTPGMPLTVLFVYWIQGFSWAQRKDVFCFHYACSLLCWESGAKQCNFTAAPALAPEALEEILRTRQLLGGCCRDEGPVLQPSTDIIKTEQQCGILWRANWISWPWWQQRFVPLACVTAMLPCSEEGRDLLFTQICMSC